MEEQENDYDNWAQSPMGQAEAKIKDRMKQEAKEKFIATVYSGYDLLVSKGKGAIGNGEGKEALSAIRRMMGVMEYFEEYEKCHFLKEFLIRELNASDTSPIYPEALNG